MLTSQHGEALAYKHIPSSGFSSTSEKADIHEFTVVWFGRFNDPSAGSPTETLLRLLLPLGGRV